MRARREHTAGGRDPTGVLIDRDERTSGDLLQLVDEAVRPPGIDRALEVPVAPVISDDQPVALRRTDHHTGIGTEAARVEPGLQAESGAHRRAPAGPPFPGGGGPAHRPTPGVPHPGPGARGSAPAGPPPRAAG